METIYNYSGGCVIPVSKVYTKYGKLYVKYYFRKRDETGFYTDTKLDSETYFVVPVGNLKEPKYLEVYNTEKMDYITLKHLKNNIYHGNENINGESRQYSFIWEEIYMDNFQNHVVW